MYNHESHCNKGNRNRETVNENVRTISFLSKICLKALFIKITKKKKNSLTLLDYYHKFK